MILEQADWLNQQVPIQTLLKGNWGARWTQQLALQQWQHENVNTEEINSPWSAEWGSARATSFRCVHVQTGWTGRSQVTLGTTMASMSNLLAPGELVRLVTDWRELHLRPATPLIVAVWHRWRGRQRFFTYHFNTNYVEWSNAVVSGNNQELWAGHYEWIGSQSSYVWWGFWQNLWWCKVWFAFFETIHAYPICLQYVDFKAMHHELLTNVKWILICFQTLQLGVGSDVFATNGIMVLFEREGFLVWWNSEDGSLLSSSQWFRCLGISCKSVCVEQ